MDENELLDVGGRPNISTFIPGARGRTGPMVGNLWQTAPIKRAIRAGSIGVLRPLQTALNPNAALKKDEWIAFDNVVTRPRRETLVGYSDLQARGLTFNLPNPLGHLTLEWEKNSEVSPAKVHILMGTPSEDDLADFGLNGIPIPIVSKGFTLDERLLQAGRNRGTAIDVTNADGATRQVALAVDDLFFNANFNYGGYTLYGYTTHPQRSTAAHGTNGLWSAGAKTGANILADALTIFQTFYTNKVDGPFVMYVPPTYWRKLQDDFKAESEDTIMDRLMKIAGLEEIRISYALTDEIVVVAMQSINVDAVVGFAPTMVQWEEGGGAVNRFRVMAILLPRIKTDYGSISGIFHMVGT